MDYNTIINLKSQFQTKKLKVVVLKDAMPFATCTPNFEGIAVDIWKKTAEKYNLDYEFICYPGYYDDILKKLSNGDIDVVLAEISVIRRRYDWALYSRPYYISELYIYKKHNNYLFNLLYDLQLLYILATIIFVVFVYTFLLMCCNVTLTDALYKTFSSFCMDLGPELLSNCRKLHGLPIKGLNLFWIFFVFLFRSFILSRIIVSVMRKDFIDDDELTRINKVNVLKASAHIDMIKMIGKTPVEINTHDEMVKKINESNDDEYWFEDSHIINNIMKNSNNVNNLSKTKRPVAMDEYTIAVNKIYPQIVDMIDSTLVEMQGNGTILKICKAYIDNYDKCLL